MLTRVAAPCFVTLSRFSRETAARSIFSIYKNVRRRESSCYFRFRRVFMRSFCDKLATGSQATGLHNSQSSPDNEGHKERNQDCITDCISHQPRKLETSSCQNDSKSKLDDSVVDEGVKDIVTHNTSLNKSSLTSDFSSNIGGNLPGNTTNIENKSANLDTAHYPLISQFQLPSDWRKGQQGVPGIKFAGDIYVIKTTQDELEHVNLLEEFLQEKVLGFDAEHCPVQHLVCVVQLATHDKAVLWQCFNFKKKLPHYLKELLVGNVSKVGHACMDDAIMISNQFKVEPQNLIDTCRWARDLNCTQHSLQGLCAIFLEQHLSKTHQQSNWKKENLSLGQIRYAATDAWISLKVYEEMERHANRLGVALTPMYKNLQERYQEVLTSRRLKNRRRRQRIKEKKDILREKALDAQQNTATTNEDIVQDTDILEGNTSSELFDEVNSTDQTVSELPDSLDSIPECQIHDEKNDTKKTSIGSRQRHKKFLAKFHTLE